MGPLVEGEPASEFRGVEFPLDLIPGNENVMCDVTVVLNDTEQSFPLALSCFLLVD